MFVVFCWDGGVEFGEFFNVGEVVLVVVYVIFKSV